MSPEAVQDQYREAMRRHGVRVTLRRYTGSAGGATRPRFDYGSILARVRGFKGADLVGEVRQGDRRCILLAEDVFAAGIAMPLLKGDKVLLRGAELNVEDPDADTVRVGEVLIAFILRLRGP